MLVGRTAGRTSGRAPRRWGLPPARVTSPRKGLQPRVASTHTSPCTPVEKGVDDRPHKRALSGLCRQSHPMTSTWLSGERTPRPNYFGSTPVDGRCRRSERCRRPESGRGSTGLSPSCAQGARVSSTRCPGLSPGGVDGGLPRRRRGCLGCSEPPTTTSAPDPHPGPVRRGRAAGAVGGRPYRRRRPPSSHPSHPQHACEVPCEPDRVRAWPMPGAVGARLPGDRNPPQDMAAEQSVLGAMMISKDAIADVAEVVRGADSTGRATRPSTTRSSTSTDGASRPTW